MLSVLGPLGMFTFLVCLLLPTSSFFRTLVEMGYHFLINCLYHRHFAEKKLAL